ncbi:hypothetical protein D7D25_07180 [Proteiniphilum sp. X52]|nr:hypothetical protein D7D25_07180 [Proteiniphilum sp. X52]
MDKIPKVDKVNEYARYIGAPVLHPLGSLFTCFALAVGLGSRHLFEGHLGEVAAVGILAVNHQHGGADLIDVGRRKAVPQPGACPRNPATVRADGAGMIAARGPVEVYCAFTTC